MTYWQREHEQNLRRIGDATRDLEAIRDDNLRTLIRELAEDDHDATTDSRARLTEACVLLGRALGALDRARDQLPEPKKPRPPVFPTAATVMDRDA